MLKTLFVKSFVIIDEVTMEFEEGFTVLTGETGAGKSILIDALGQLCGQRGSPQFIKKGEQKACIEGVFDMPFSKELEKILEEQRIPVDDDIVLSKEIFENGRSVVKVNYQTVSNMVLKQISPFILNIHTQFETQDIFQRKNHIRLLDQFQDNPFDDVLLQYKDVYKTYTKKISELKELENEESQEEQLDFLQSQCDEIDELPYTDEEVEDLEKELEVLQSFEKINSYYVNYQGYIQKGQNTALSLLKSALYELNQLGQFEQFNDYQIQFESLYYQLEDLNDSITHEFNSLDFNEYRFNELQDLLYQINKLKRKYGYTMSGINEYKEELTQKIHFINHREDIILKLKEEVSHLKNECYKIADQIHNMRMNVASEFEKKVETVLLDLYMPNTQFKINIQKDELNSHGYDDVSFMIAVNLGQNLSLLNETASGGEISRVILALKTLILEKNNLPTIIFDEVDTGVSGKVATAIGDKMYNLAKSKQVLAITHLPQVASKATQHFLIEKTDNTIQTLTTIKKLNNNDRIDEIAKMLSGETISTEARENAKILLNV